MWQPRSAETIEISEADALQAAREFAIVLGETPEYQAFDEAQFRLRRDPAAQEAIRAFPGAATVAADDAHAGRAERG